MIQGTSSHMSFLSFCPRRDRGVCRKRGGQFVMLKLAFQSTLGGQFCYFVLVPEKIGWLRKASLYPVFPVNRYLLYQVVGSPSRGPSYHCKCVEVKITWNIKYWTETANSRISRHLLMRPPWFGTKCTNWPKYWIQTCLSSSIILFLYKNKITDLPSQSCLKGKLKQYKLALPSSCRHLDHTFIP